MKMKKEEKYRKVIERLKKVEPVLEDKEQLTNKIMSSISKVPKTSETQEKMFYFFFGWVRNPWMRLAMASITILFLVVFSYQQFIIGKRISSLEYQLSMTENVSKTEEAGMAISQRVMIKILSRTQEDDSITVSKDDLEKLLNSYLELQENYESLKPAEQKSPLFRELIRRDKNEKKQENSESKNL